MSVDALNKLSQALRDSHIVTCNLTELGFRIQLHVAEARAVFYKAITIGLGSGDQARLKDALGQFDSAISGAKRTLDQLLFFPGTSEKDGIAISALSTAFGDYARIAADASAPIRSAKA